ncbi:MAG: hypothetical protein ACR2JY_24295 [Chloroflexota bacterium]
MRALQELLLAYSDWLDSLLLAYPTGQPALDERLAGRVHARHRFWSALRALPRGCLLNLGSVRSDISWLRMEELQSFAATWAVSPPGTGTYEVIAAARRRVLDAFPLPPWPDRLRALSEVARITQRTFRIASAI